MWTLAPDALGPLLPRTSNGFHLVDSRMDFSRPPEIACDRCDVIPTESRSR
jgi:hypothetical protein